MMSDDNDTKPTAEPLSAGFVLVDVVLTAHQAFIVRKWAEAAKFKITAAKAEQAKMDINARSEVEDFRPRCV